MIKKYESKFEEEKDLKEGTTKWVFNVYAVIGMIEDATEKESLYHVAYSIINGDEAINDRAYSTEVDTFTSKYNADKNRAVYNLMNSKHLSQEDIYDNLKGSKLI